MADLDSFPRPGVTVDVAVLTVSAPSESLPQLRVLVQERRDPGGRSLPGGFIRERWTVDQTVDDVLRRKVGIEPSERNRPRLLRLFDDPERDDRSWVISAAHSLSLPESELLDATGDLVPVGADGRLRGERRLLFDHDEIVTAAVEALRERYEIRYRYVDIHPDPDGFLPEPFTLRQLRRVHEAVVGAELHKDNFNRRMREYVEPLTRNGKVVVSDGLRGRPATLYRKSH
jgi:8-oxo-dGTP diphosphatase